MNQFVTDIENNEIRIFIGIQILQIRKTITYPEWNATI